jgi:hypothetical protein
MRKLGLATRDQSGASNAFDAERHPFADQRRGREIFVRGCEAACDRLFEAMYRTPRLRLRHRTGGMGLEQDDARGPRILRQLG